MKPVPRPTVAGIVAASAAGVRAVVDARVVADAMTIAVMPANRANRAGRLKSWSLELLYCRSPSCLRVGGQNLHRRCPCREEVEQVSTNVRRSARVRINNARKRNAGHSEN